MNVKRDEDRADRLLATVRGKNNGHLECAFSSQPQGHAPIQGMTTIFDLIFLSLFSKNRLCREGRHALHASNRSSEKFEPRLESARALFLAKYIRLVVEKKKRIKVFSAIFALSRCG